MTLATPVVVLHSEYPDICVTKERHKFRETGRFPFPDHLMNVDQTPLSGCPDLKLKIQVSTSGCPGYLIVSSWLLAHTHFRVLFYISHYFIREKYSANVRNVEYSLILLGNNFNSQRPYTVKLLTYPMGHVLREIDLSRRLVLGCHFETPLLGGIRGVWLDRCYCIAIRKLRASIAIYEMYSLSNVILVDTSFHQYLSNSHKCGTIVFARPGAILWA